MYEDGNEVIAIDLDKSRLQAIDPYCTEAVVLQATDKEKLKELVPENFILVPHADFVIKDSDILMILGKSEDIRKIKVLKA